MQPGDVYYSFSAQRYGSPRLILTATGVRVRWESAYDAGLGQFTQTTVTHAAGTQFAGSCSGTLLTCSVTVNKDTQVQANFK